LSQVFFSLPYQDVATIQTHLFEALFCHFIAKKQPYSWVLVAHVYNPSYSGGRDQEDHGSKPAWANSSRDPILKKPNTKKGWRSGSSVGPKFKPQYCPTPKKKTSYRQYVNECVYIHGC
jgi:hypothetical protein